MLSKPCHVLRDGNLSVTHRYRLTVSVASLKHSCLQTRISVHSALEFFVVDALYKSTFTYLLTYYHSLPNPVVLNPNPYPYCMAISVIRPCRASKPLLIDSAYPILVILLTDKETDRHGWKHKHNLLGGGKTIKHKRMKRCIIYSLLRQRYTLKYVFVVETQINRKRKVPVCKTLQTDRPKKNLDQTDIFL